MCDIGCWWEAAVKQRELSSVLWDVLDGWDRDGWDRDGWRGRFKREGDICTRMVDSQLYSRNSHSIVKQL